jgi:acyl-homoserine lactone acylase PvdQ
MKTIVIKWSTEDVLAMAESMDIELTETQADQILDNLIKYHDANVGINWDVINFHIENFIEKN